MLSRRAFLLNSAALAAAPNLSLAAEPEPTILKLQRRAIEVNGKAASVYAIGRSDGVGGVVADRGSRFRVRVENELADSSLLHWHGLTPPSAQDGVPGLSGPAIPPGGSAEYDFPLPFGGTYFMHAHYGFQEQLLLAAPLIVRDPKRYADWQEVVVMLADFSFRSPQEIYAALTGGRAPGHATGMGHDMGGMAMDHAAMDHAAMGHAATRHSDMGEMAGMPTPMAKPDLNDVDYDAFLANERTLADPQVVQIENGGRVLLRVINSAAMSAFHVDLGENAAKLVAVDGQDVAPVAGSRFPIAVGQRLDLLVETPKGGGAIAVFFVLEGEARRTGLILAPPRAHISRLPDKAEAASAALDLSLEEQLRAAAPLAARKADRVVPIDLTGDMASYVWSINNVVWDEKTPPIALKSGERVELAMTNRTMMSHPMHLHGHRFQVVDIDGRRFDGALRDTVLVPPGKRVVVAFDADNPGHWAFHCHLLYHAQAGMFASFKYS
ncbi:multicopper oxidase family protein [Methylocystis parvus]|uniref:multicopper oxidase family protein n=1 Tax=Methylocystis parvus TaxID=134 RepID=UPI003C796DDE